MWVRSGLLDPHGTCLPIPQITAPHVLLTLNKQEFLIGLFGLDMSNTTVNNGPSARGDMAALRGYGKQVRNFVQLCAIIVNKQFGVGAVCKQREKEMVKQPKTVAFRVTETELEAIKAEIGHALKFNDNNTVTKAKTVNDVIRFWVSLNLEGAVKRLQDAKKKQEAAEKRKAKKVANDTK
jgi:hypothetical protein